MSPADEQRDFGELPQCLLRRGAIPLLAGDVDTLCCGLEERVAEVVGLLGQEGGQSPELPQITRGLSILQCVDELSEINDENTDLIQEVQLVLQSRVDRALSFGHVAPVSARRDPD